eukprot:g5044.t1
MNKRKFFSLEFPHVRLLYIVKDCDVNRVDKLFGSTALSKTVYMGANKVQTVNALLDAGAVENEDADPDVVRIILEKLKSSCSPREFASIVNYKRTSTTIKWKGIYLVARTLYRTGLTNTGLFHSLAVDSGTSALNLAVIRGDVEIVKILLENGADPYVENDLEMNTFDICNKTGPFPSVDRALQEHVNQDE